MRRLGPSILPVLLAACNPSGGSAETAPAQKTPTKTAEKPPAAGNESAESQASPPERADDAPDEPRPVPTAEPEVVTEVASGFNNFGLDLYRKVATGDGDVVISPASVALALTMTQAGARAQTSKQMQTTLHYPRAAPVVQTAVATMLATWTKDREADIELSVANRLFGEKTVPFEKPFLSLTQRFFQAPLEPLDFKGAADPSRVHINDWVAGKTHDRIKDLVPPGGITSDTRLALVNAIYFKAQWMHGFTKSRTAPATFHAPSGSRNVPTMHLNQSLAVHDAPGATVVHLDYQHPGYSMTLVVPNERDGLGAIEASLGPELLGQWTGATKYEQVELSMPKFRIASESLRLAAHLKALGMTSAFGDDADFTGIAPAAEQIQISEVFHKGFIEVDENGTEAAAATAVVARFGGAPPMGEPRTIKVDRPFLYFIRDKSSGLLLFFGRVSDPQTE